MLPHKFTPVEAARVAAATPTPYAVTGSVSRLLWCAAVLWCRDLMFPTARTIAATLGLASSSAALANHPTLVDVQAAVIEVEWGRLQDGLVGSADPVPWLVRHSAALAVRDPVLLRLPGLVRAAVVEADPRRGKATRPWAPLLYALGAFAEPGVECDPGAIEAMLSTIASSMKVTDQEARCRTSSRCSSMATACSQSAG